ncbi:porin family protein [Vibrio tubiashii]|uniref:outer membrane protein n=1 Tax=Vibrio tubiashii TaxID=29498 RepID=UPI001EFE9244|nr:porin family protein [Vibrio tubiashii]MCG9581128.1 porin family protein [Vibrio tubiashii]MCG9614719.1 porin family protein [Vibrio tubiashii]MCG9687827.1 porin family protein [Vibrio tubiashii]
MKKVLSVAAVALALSATAAQAHEGLYVGGNFQMGNFDLKPEVKEANDAFGGKYTAATVNLVAGYDFNQYFAVEGRVGIPSSTETTSKGDAYGTLTLEGKPQTSYAVFGKGTLPITEMFSVYALAGVGSSPYKVEATATAGSHSINGSEKFDGVSLQYAAGVEVNFTPQIAMTAEYGMYGYGKKEIVLANDMKSNTKYDTTAFNIGIKYKF